MKKIYLIICACFVTQFAFAQQDDAAFKRAQAFQEWRKCIERVITENPKTAPADLSALATLRCPKPNL